MRNADNYAWIGGALIATQRVEFLTHGIVSHFNSIGTNKKFKKLTSRVFLDDTEENKKLRRQTLGQIFEVLKEEISLSIENELDEYLSKRNKLVHEFWREYYKDKAENINDSSIVAFCINFIQQSEKLEKFYKGFLYAMAKRIAEINKLKINKSMSELHPNYNYFLECLRSNKLI